MGNYVFDADVLVDALREDAANAASKHDMGGDIIPMMVGTGTAQVYDFATNEVPGATDGAAWSRVWATQRNPAPPITHWPSLAFLRPWRWRASLSGLSL